MPESYHLILSPQMMQIIGGALGRLPYTEVAAVIAEIQRQITDQERVATEANSAKKDS